MVGSVSWARCLCQCLMRIARFSGSKKDSRTDCSQGDENEEAEEEAEAEGDGMGAQLKV